MICLIMAIINIPIIKACNESLVLTEARTLIAKIRNDELHSSYARDIKDNCFDETSSKCCFNCYGFIDWLLTRYAFDALTELQVFQANSLSDIAISPDLKLTPYHYHMIAQHAKDSLQYWETIHNLIDLRSGDFLIYIPIDYTFTEIPPAPGVRTGTHIMMIDHINRNVKESLELTIIDATRTLHNRDDIRSTDGGIGQSMNIKISADITPGHITLQWSKRGQIHRKLFSILRLK